MQNPNESYTNKYQKHIANYKFSKPFKSYLGKDTVYNFIKSTIKESKYSNEVMKNILAKNLWWLKKRMKILRTLQNVEFVIIIILMVMLK